MSTCGCEVTAIALTITSIIKFSNLPHVTMNKKSSTSMNTVARENAARVSIEYHTKSAVEKRRTELAHVVVKLRPLA